MVPSVAGDSPMLGRPGRAPSPSSMPAPLQELWHTAIIPTTRDQAAALALGACPGPSSPPRGVEVTAVRPEGPSAELDHPAPCGTPRIPPTTALRVVGVPHGGGVPQDRSISPFHPCAAPLTQATKQDKPRQRDPVGCLLCGGFPPAPGVFPLHSDPVQLHHHFRRRLSPGPAAGVLQQRLRDPPGRHQDDAAAAAPGAQEGQRHG